MKIWIFLPAYNEEESLRRLLPKLRAAEARLSAEKVVVFVLDDGSSDGTSRIALEAAGAQEMAVVAHPINRGLGETERDGFEYLAAHCADDDIIVRLDCDDTHEPEYIESLVRKLAEGYDVVNTSRFQPGGYQKGVNWYRRGISRGANVFMKVLFGLRGIRDYSCGFRAYRGKLVKDAVRIFGNGFLQMRGFGFTSTLEIVVKLHLLGARFAEVPFGLRYDQKASESKMVSSTTMIGYFVMALLYHWPGGWRSWRKPLVAAYSESAAKAAEAFAAIRRTKSVPSRFGACRRRRRDIGKGGSSMCGISGFVGKGASAPARQQQIRRSMAVLAHRGPDGEGLAAGAEFCFGHRRLAILDVEHGNQPMVSDDGAVTLVFNGEIYNYLELRQELVREGVRFHTVSDTEVLLRCYERYGRKALARLNGMFAFAIFDARENLLFAARDHFGIKPFYYATLPGGGLAFASEIKALFCLPELERRADAKGLHEYLTFQFCLGDKTLFAGVKKLMPGHSMTFRPATGKLEIAKWWSPSFHVDNHHTKEYFEDKLRWLVHDSVKGQLRSDVPIGAYLSGGLDSSVVVASAATQYGPGFKCFTGKFAEGESYDESRYARIVASEFGCEYHEVVPTAADFADSMRLLIYHMDEPAAGPGLLPQYVVSRLAKKHVKVVLGGQGGDEIFGGYARYLVAYLEQCVKGAIFQTQEEGSHIVTLESIIPNLPLLKDYVPMIQGFWTSGVFDSMEERYFKLLDRSQRIRRVVTGELAREFGGEAIREEFHRIFTASESQSYFNKMTYFDQCTLLPALLQVEDRVSMAVSLESRVPLLDYRIADLAASMPPSIKFAGGRSKNALKESMKSILPEAVVSRQDKMGFPVPLSEWLKGPLKEFVADTLLGRACRERGLFDVGALRGLVENEAKYGREIWGALCLELWFEDFLDGPAPAGSGAGAAAQALAPQG